MRAAALERKVLSGFDNITGTATTFRVGGSVFREDLVSDVSGSTARHRSIVCALSTAIFGSPERPLPNIVERLVERNLRAYLAERNTPLFRSLREQLPADLFTFSEYFGNDCLPGGIVDGVRHEDLQATSFADRSFDLIITSEVMEHVPDAPRAERELVRILRPGGAYCFTVPLDRFADSDTILAETLPDGTVRFHAEPVYHGDPIAHRVSWPTEYFRSPISSVASPRPAANWSRTATGAKRSEFLTRIPWFTSCASRLAEAHRDSAHAAPRAHLLLLAL